MGHTRPRALTVNSGSLDVREQHVCISTSSRAALYRSSKLIVPVACQNGAETRDIRR